MEILTEFDELQAALAKVNMDESVFPYVNGKLIDSDAYNKTQKILNCPEMISAHKYLYNLDMDQLTEEEEDKISKLYDLGVKRGFIVDDLTKWDDDGTEVEDDAEAAEVEEKPVDAQPKNTLFKAKVPCWTVIYSATKDGDIKTGEAYSNAVSMNAAKADVNAKLSQCGYDNITILAIENCTDAPKLPEAPAEEQIDAVAISEADDEAAEDKEDAGSSSLDDSDEDSSGDESSEEPADDAEDDSSSEDSGKDDEAESGDDDEDAGDEDASSSGDSAEDSDEDTSSNEDAGDGNEEDAESKDDSDEEADDAGNEEESTEDSDEDKGEDDEEKDELDANEKAELRDLYRKTFKNTLVKCKFDTSFNDLTLEQKVKFFTELSKAWKKENEPQEFMTDKEVEQLNNVVAQKSADSEDDKEEESSEEDESK